MTVRYAVLSSAVLVDVLFVLPFNIVNTRFYSIRHGNLSPYNPKGIVREGGLATPGAGIWINMPSTWTTLRETCRDSPRTEKPGGSRSVA